MVALSREAAPDATFEQIPAQKPCLSPDDHFDGAVILNSLHHIPEDRVDAALGEAMRVVKPGAPFLILEPLARGGYQEVFAPIDDETEIRAMALAKLDAFIERSAVHVALRTEFETLVPEESAEAVPRGSHPCRPIPQSTGGGEARRGHAAVMFHM